MWIRGIARTCAEAGLSKRNSWNASDHLQYWPRADLRTFQAFFCRTRTGGEEGSHSGDHQGSTGGNHQGDTAQGNREREDGGPHEANAGSDYQPAGR